MNPVLKGVTVRGIPIRMIDELPEFIRENHVEIATLTLPKSRAREMAEILVENGIRAIWNFCPYGPEPVSAKGCDRGKCASLGKPHETFL